MEELPDQPPISVADFHPPSADPKRKYILVGALILIILLLGLSFYFYSKYFKKEVAISSPPPSVESISLPGNILYLDRDNSLKNFNFQKNSTTSLLSEKQLQQNNIKIIHSVIPSPDRKTLLLKAYNSDDYQFKIANLIYLTVSVKGEDLLPLSSNKITNDLRFPGYLNIQGWENNDTLLFSISKLNQEKSTEVIIGRYNLKEKRTQKLYQTSGNIDLLHFNQTNQKLYFLNNNQLEIVSLINSTQQKYNLNLNLANSGGLKTFYASSLLSKMNIYSILSPDKPLMSASHPALSSTTWVIWSPQNNYFTFSAKDSSLGKTTYVYNRDGRLITSIDNLDLWEGSIFSEDEKNLLVIYYKDSPEQLFKVIDLKSGRAKELKFPNFFSKPILWLI